MNRRNGPFSKHHLMTKIRGLPTQRQDRIGEVLNVLSDRGWIETIPIPTENRVLYNISDQGRSWYEQLGKKFLEFVHDIHQSDDR